MHRAIPCAAFSSLTCLLAGMAFAAPESPAQPARVTVSSELSNLRIAAPDTLPQAPPTAAGLDSFCQNQAIEPATPGGKLAAARGWIVTSEAPLGPYTAIGLFSNGTNGTSGVCVIENGHIAVWQGEHLLAVVYGARLPEEVYGRDAGMQIVGGVRPLENTPPAVRIWDWLGGGPTADLVLDQNRLQVRLLAASDSVCHGRNTVPNIFGLHMRQAREKLALQGWLPSQQDIDGKPYDNDPDSDTVKYRKEEHMMEVQSCSGTGMGYCNLHYHHANGARLRVTSAEHLEWAAFWTVKCP